MGQAESKSLNGEKVFERSAKYGTNRVIYFEDLVEADDVQPQDNIKIGKLYLRFYEWAKRSRDEFERDYRRAVANLERAAPNLKELRIEGCYAYKPDLNSLPEAKDMFENEASLLQNRLEGLMYAWKNCPIQLYRVELSVFWIVDKKTPSSINFERLGRRAFGPKAQMKEKDDGAVQWQYYWEDTALYVSFHFLDENEHKTTAPGRCLWHACRTP
ncbi:hypothetical protein M3Y97_01032500 [Aphelenchoides bicaudatus]|nr:hypothetical protein M3Y97_01032500 [Aphelenchoides bicaudatus]